MKRSGIVLIAFFVLICSSLQAQVNVKKVSGGELPLTKEGLFYSLPRTVVNIEVKIDKVQNYKGPYADYALRLLGLKNVIPANSVDYRISSISVTTTAEPDPEQYYFVETGEKSEKGEIAGLFMLDPSGLILGTIPLPSENKEIVIREAGPGEDPLQKDLFGELFKYSADISVFEKVDTIIRKISLDTLTVERQFYKRTVVEKSPDQKAKEAADFISKIKENRFNLLSGVQEVNYNKETLEYMDSQLSTMEKEYMKLFTGVSISESLTFHYKYIPVTNQINTEIPVFKFSRSKGVVDLDEQGGKVVTVKVQRVGNTNALSGYLTQAQKPVKQQGLTYRIPELAKVTVKYDEMIHETQCLVNQLGAVASLPANRWKVQYHPETGGIRGMEY